MPGKLIVSGLKALDIGPVNLEINPGETVCIKGDSGSGKSIMLKAIVDIIPHDGDVFLGTTSMNMVSGPEWRKKVGLLPASSSWWEDRVRDHFIFPEQTDFGIMGFENDILEWEIKRLSSGEKQRLSILRLLENRPEALLLDEPTANLDPGNTERVENIISDFSKSTGCPVIWVSHDTAQADRIASRLFIMNNGKLTEG
ncbi:ABC transporter ATP-binding protein [Desulforegula conservatrix]|uniref:ABC transporter ATP-binding protein n=1 Tax=Desulforegula conservatrix TaxID=153026 RepID=UPI0003F5CF33|nr:ATP-binding cassette domain-containing protein [Desulforegula conservatrix]